MGTQAESARSLTNLVGNAIKFTPNGNIVMAVECEVETGETASMRVTVTDTGIGIPPEKVDSLWQKFSQADTSTTRKYGGTGLGLAISKQLVELMGGAIGCESQVGVGSKFWFKLRLPLDTQLHPAAIPALDLSGLRVLIVDDNEINRRVVHEQISSWGMRNGSYASADEALEAVKSAQASGDPYHFVISDYQMPNVNGAMLASMIKSDASTRDTVFVMLTSVGHRSELRELEGASVDACLVKPVRQSHLMNTLSTLWCEETPVRIRGQTSVEIRKVNRRFEFDAGDSSRRVSAKSVGRRRQCRQPGGRDAHARARLGSSLGCRRERP